MTIYFNFDNGSVGTLTHQDPAQIQKWVEIFSRPDAMRECGILSIKVQTKRAA